MTTALQIHDPAPVSPIADMKTFLARVNSPAGFDEQQQLAIAYDAACKALIGPNDVQLDGDREFKKKSAWRKLGRHFTISTVVVSSKIEHIANPELDEEDRLITVASVVVRGIAVWGQSSEAIGVCATDEESGQRVITIADALATAETRATNRAISNLIAMGEVSAEEINKGDGSARAQNGPPQRKERPAEEIKMPFGPSKGRLLGTIETKDLEGALRWAEDKSEEKGSPQFADFQKAAKQVLEARRKPAPAPAAGSGDPAAAPAAPEKEEEPLDLDGALRMPFPFQRGKPNYGKPMGSFSTEHLIELQNWILSTGEEQGNPKFHARTRAAITLILSDREKDQTKLDLEPTEAAGNKGTPLEYGTPLKSSREPASSSQEAKSPRPATGGGPQPHPPGKISDALEVDPTSRSAYYARIRKALTSPAISPETRQLYQDDNVNGFKGAGRHSIDWWADKLEQIAAQDPESFPSALEDTAAPGKDGLPF